MQQIGTNWFSELVNFTVSEYSNPESEYSHPRQKR